MGDRTRPACITAGTTVRSRVPGEPPSERVTPNAGKGGIREHQGWPFLVGRGIHVGNQILIAPAVLDLAEIISLAQVATPSTDAPCTERIAADGGGHGSYTVVYRARAVLQHEVQGSTDTSSGQSPLYDEHSRPIELLTGFVVEGIHHLEVANDDLARSWDAALDIYRQFLDSEETFQVARSSPFRLMSSLTPDRPSSTAKPDQRSSDSPQVLTKTLVTLAAIVLLAAAFVVWTSNSSTVGDLLRLEAASDECSDFAGRLGQTCELRFEGAQRPQLNLSADPPDALGSWSLNDDCESAKPGTSWVCTVAIEGGGSEEVDRLELVVANERTGNTLTVSLPIES